MLDIWGVRTAAPIGEANGKWVRTVRNIPRSELQSSNCEVRITEFELQVRTTTLEIFRTAASYAGGVYESGGDGN